MVDWRGQEGERNIRAPGQGRFGQVERSLMCPIRSGRRSGSCDIAEVFEECQCIGQVPQGLRFLGIQAGGEKVIDLARIVEEGECAEAGAGEGAGGVEHALQDVVEVEALVDAQVGLAQLGQPLSEHAVLPSRFVGLLHGLPPSLAVKSGPAARLYPFRRN